MSSLSKLNIKKDAFKKDSLRTDFNKQLQQELAKLRRGSSTSTPTNIQDFELIMVWKLNSDLYQEFVYTGEDITQINYWSDNTKATKLFTKNITYSSGNPTVITVLDETTDKIYITTINYTGDEVVSITKYITDAV